MRKNQQNRRGFWAYLKTKLGIVKLSVLMFIIPAISNAAETNSSLIEQVVSKNEIAVSSVADILKDGKGNFDPWNKERWAEWYNGKGEIIKPFELNVDIVFSEPKKIWNPVISPEYTPSDNLFVIKCQGIVVDGNGVTIDITSEDQNLPLEVLFKKGSGPWKNGSQLQGFRYRLSKIVGITPTILKNITLKGFDRGVKIDNSGDSRNPGGVFSHPIIVTNCKFIRNGIGFYTNGDNGVLQNCEIMESGNGAIYSGSGSHDNKFTGNTFRDNNLSQGQFSYGDFIGDTFFNTIIEGNNFIPSLVDVNQRLHGISIFRNMGESNNLRKNIPHNNIIRNNTFNGYSIAITIGARMGRDTRNDVTGEGRDYAFDNLIEANVFNNTDIGIKINTDGNTVRNNIFSNVDNEIVLHCIFFSLKNNTIEYQASNSVKLWYVLDDYLKYKAWFGFADNLNGEIKKSEKLIEVYSKKQSPHFPSDMGDIFVLKHKNRSRETAIEDQRVGLPMKTARGEFSLSLPGEETVAIWNEKITRVNDKDFYSILIFDKNGTEINRCGLSEIKWGQLAVGHFTSASGEMEIAVVPSEPINSKYPIYIFDRGYRVPKAILLQENTNPDIFISSNEKSELVVSFREK